MRSSLLDYAFSVFALYKTAAGLRVKQLCSYKTASAHVKSRSILWLCIKLFIHTNSVYTYLFIKINNFYLIQ